MTHQVRILILEDDPSWVEQLTKFLKPHCQHINSAMDLAAAQQLIQNEYFNIAIIDVSLQENDMTDEQGITFMHWMKENGYDESVQTIVFSNYGSLDRYRTAFVEYHVADFHKKLPFEPEKLLSAIITALHKNHLGRNIEVQITKQQTLKGLLEGFKWVSLEQIEHLTIELSDLLLRLFPKATRLLIQPIAAGQSGAGVLQVEPVYDGEVGRSVIVKFGKRETILRERQRFIDFVEKYVGNQSSIQLNAVSGRIMGAMTYTLIGTDLDQVKNFGEFYLSNGIANIKATFENLFNKTCRRWYDNRERGRQKRNLVELYRSTLNFEWDKMREAITSLNMNPQYPKLSFVGIQTDYINPLFWLESQNYELMLSAWLCTTHGDLNEKNILVTEDGRCWLIDFYRTKTNHILSDFVELETAIKFSLTTLKNSTEQSPLSEELDIAKQLREYEQLEALLLQQSYISEPMTVPDNHRFYMPVTTIGLLRQHATGMTDNDSMKEYFIGLLLATLYLLTIQSMEKHRYKILLSTAMICSKLDSLR